MRFFQVEFYYINKEKYRLIWNCFELLPKKSTSGTTDDKINNQ
jgi:hypothetical protein